MLKKFLQLQQINNSKFRNYSIDNIGFTPELFRTITTTKENYLIIGKKLYEWKVANFIYWKFPNMKEIQSNSVLLKYKSRKFLLDLLPSLEIRKSIKKTPISPEEREFQYIFITDTFFKIIGYLYENNGELYVENFFEQFIFSKSIDIQDILESFKPHEEIKEIFENLKYEQKKDKLTQLITTEIFSNEILIGTGTSMSERLSKDRAAKNALINYYTQEFEEV